MLVYDVARKVTPTFASMLQILVREVWGDGLVPRISVDSQTESSFNALDRLVDL